MALCKGLQAGATARLTKGLQGAYGVAVSAPTYPTTDLIGAYDIAAAVHSGASLTNWPMTAGTLGTLTPQGSVVWNYFGVQTGTNIALDTPSPIVLAGPWTFYAVISRAATGIACVVGDAATSSSAFIFANDVFYVADDSNNYVSTAFADSGTMLVRVLKDGSNNIKLTRTGVAQATLGTLAGSFTFNRIFGREFGAQWNDPNSWLACWVGYSANVAGTATETAVLATIQSLYGVTL